MKGLRIALLITAVTGVSLLISTDGWTQGGTTTPPPTLPQVSARAATINNMPVGEVLIGDTVVLRIHEAAGGYTPSQRAGVVAGRLETALGQGYTVNDILVGQMNNQAVLMMGNNLLITADAGEASVNNSTPIGLATNWQQNVMTALAPSSTTTAGTTTTPPGTTTVAGTQETWPAWTNPTTKLVPIISLGTPGASLGFAQVTGPSDRVGQVHSVVQVSAVFERVARVFVFVPSSETLGMNRVQGVAVTALLQYQVFKF